jgi:hypothetical protein
MGGVPQELRQQGHEWIQKKWLAATQGWEHFAGTTPTLGQAARNKDDTSP